MAKIFNKLTPAKVKVAKPGLHADGLGLYLQCTVGSDKKLNKSWFFRFSRDGRERRMGLGTAHEVNLAKARELADRARRLHQQGVDPIQAREAENARAQEEAKLNAAEAVTFRHAFETYFATKSQTLANAKHRAQWQSTMRTYVYPHIADKPVADVTASDIVAVLTPIWFEKPETARRVLQRIEAVFKSAILHGHRKLASPCAGVAQELGARHRKVVNHPAMPYAQLPDFVARLRTSNSWPATRLAFEWLILTATRSGETRLARWAEIDEQTALWTIPAERMKAKRPHVVPLSPRCLEILRSLRAVYPSAASDLLFPSMKAGAPLSDMTLTKVLRDMGLAGQATAHGMRSAFKVWCAEVAKVRDEVSEAALAHTITEKVRAAYLRTDFLAERKPLMAAWARFCDEPRPAYTVMPLRRPTSVT
jgi:integrase